MTVRTTRGAKLVLALATGAAFSSAGVGALFIARGFDTVGGVVVAVFLGLVFVVCGALLAIGGTLESLSPIRVYVEDGQIVIHRRRVVRLPTMRFVDVRDVQRVAIDTKTSTDDGVETSVHRVVLVLTKGGSVPIGDYHYLAELNDAKTLAAKQQSLMRG